MHLDISYLGLHGFTIAELVASPSCFNYATSAIKFLRFLILKWKHVINSYDKPGVPILFAQNHFFGGRFLAFPR